MTLGAVRRRAPRASALVLAAALALAGKAEIDTAFYEEQKAKRGM